jgi:hypothetical protein
MKNSIKEMSKALSLILLVFLFSACSKTVNAWKDNPNKEYLEVYGKEDLPLKLKAKKVEYRCVDLLYSSSGNTQKCYVLKSSAEKVDAWSSRLYETSKGALTDTGENIMVFGAIALCSMGAACSNLDISNDKSLYQLIYGD